MPTCTVERNFPGEFARERASLAPLAPSSAIFFRRAFRDVTTAISAIAKRPFAKSSRKINAISSVRDDIFGKRPSYPTIHIGANTNIFGKWIQ
jgi:hypothetical protein